MGGHVIPQCLTTDRITIKLQLRGKSRLIFKFYSVTALRAHVRLQSTLQSRSQSPRYPRPAVGNEGLWDKACRIAFSLAEI